MEKQKVISYLKKLNETKEIDISGTEDKRLIFTNDETFKIFGEYEKGVLEPFNDYTYYWLSSFFDRVTEFLDYTDFDDFDELQNLIQDKVFEWVDGEVDIYTHNLTKWLHDRNENVYYLEEAQKEYGSVEDGFKLLAMAQYKAIDEVFNSALYIMIEDLKAQFEED